ncbi:Mlp family lipoprotein [Borreliella valaisiana]|uniref:Mlp family lipoprotein n=1 Tax=Borreliella valaisiana TaxID=62088 RepID=UPI003B9FE74F
MLKEKLSDNQKTYLDWLKETLNNTEELDKFLEKNISKIMSSLDHIKSELDSCTGDQANEKKSTFKQTVQNFFSSG